MKLPVPDPGPESAERWVRAHLSDLVGRGERASAAFRGGQKAADDALEHFDVAGYAARRNEVWPPPRRGASGLSPYIRHGLLTLPEVWDAVEGGPRRDVDKFRDELLWQEYARHLYARLGRRLSRPLRHRAKATGETTPWSKEMLCIAVPLKELRRDGWMVNQTRMWLASHWSVRHGNDWRQGEDEFFRELLDGSRAANRLGWQWTTGLGSSKAYGFARGQVERRAPGLCSRCTLRGACPIESWPQTPRLERLTTPPQGLRRDADVQATSGPSRPVRRGRVERVWLTAESLGREDPARRAHPDRPVVFVFDEPLLARLGLAFQRFAFLVETLAELATTREVHLLRGSPSALVDLESVAVTFAPVPGFRRTVRRREPAELHPWPWLASPHDGPIQSFTAWRRRLEGVQGAR